MNIFDYVGKPAIIAQKLQCIACNKLHMKPRFTRHHAAGSMPLACRMQVDGLVDQHKYYI